MFATTTRSTDTKPIVQALWAILLVTALVVAGSVIALPRGQTDGIPAAAGAAVSVPVVTGEDVSDLNWAGFRMYPASVGDNDLDWSGFRMTAPSAGDKDLDWDGFVMVPSFVAGGATSPDRGYGRDTGFVQAPSFPAGGTSADRGYGRDTGFVQAPSFPAGGTSADRGYGRDTGFVQAPSFSAGAGNTQERGLGHR